VDGIQLNDQEKDKVKWTIGQSGKFKVKDES
jgi:hypothetical protein